jgi:hypothetical protein
MLGYDSFETNQVYRVGYAFPRDRGIANMGGGVVTMRSSQSTSHTQDVNPTRMVCVHSIPS